MTTFNLGDLEKIHLALDMAQRFVRGEKYHGDKPQVLLQEFDQIKEKVHGDRYRQTYAMEAGSLLRSDVQDANYQSQ
ncbi:hypothetical protein [Brevibacillus fulvus]|uniref:Uncharacterized protein n=1 Tax=Brevibacillus fulvus TaxID=1125967 RepID=A0A938XUP6_9BACL|nr:hypothetical protein [Brevibacillus fulvus]MBM7590813.1 hypothetical protein [Brevibacillus fulvus]